MIMAMGNRVNIPKVYRVAYVSVNANHSKIAQLKLIHAFKLMYLTLTGKMNWMVTQL